MKLLRSTIFLVIAIATTPVLAQVGIYGKFETTHFSTASNNFTSTGWFYGPGAGIYYDFLHLGPASLGADLRGNLLFGTQQNPRKFRSALFGLRLAVKVPAIPIKPYVQGSVGVGGPTHNGLYGVGTIYSNKFQYQVLGGVDLTILPHLDWRVAEVGYGRISSISDGAPAGADSIFTAGTGLVLRLP